MSEFFSVLSSLAIIGVVITYFKQVISGSSTPNSATWLIWTIISLMNTVTYFSVVQGDWFKNMTTSFVAIGISAIFVYSLLKGKFAKVKKEDLIIISMAFVAGVFWKSTGDPIVTNLLLQGILLISFYPTFMGLIHKRLVEKPLPWNLAVLSYSMLICAILSDWRSGSWLELVHPIINGIVGNGSIAIVVNMQKTQSI